MIISQHFILLWFWLSTSFQKTLWRFQRLPIYVLLNRHLRIYYDKSYEVTITFYWTSHIRMCNPITSLSCVFFQQKRAQFMHTHHKIVNQMVRDVLWTFVSLFAYRLHLKRICMRLDHRVHLINVIIIYMIDIVMVKNVNTSNWYGHSHRPSCHRI